MSEKPPHWCPKCGAKHPRATRAAWVLVHGQGGGKPRTVRKAGLTRLTVTVAMRDEDVPDRSAALPAFMAAALEWARSLPHNRMADYDPAVEEAEIAARSEAARVRDGAQPTERRK